MHMVGPGWPMVGLWSQVTSANVEPFLTLLALRRWYIGLTLAAPGGSPGLSALGAWGAGLGGLLLLAVVFQGPGRAFRQLFDVPGHVRMVVDAVRRVFRAGRMVATVIFLTVLSWTGSQAFTFRHEAGRESMLLVTRGHTTGELALDHGVRAALTPLRDVAGLASNLPLLVLAGLFLFRATAWGWGFGVPEHPALAPRRPSGWANVGWVCAKLYVLYRLACLAAGSFDLPLGGCVVVESVVVPAVMLMADGILLSWLLAELRQAGPGAADTPVFDACAAAELMPGAVLACLVILPGRYLMTCLLLAAPYVPVSVMGTPVGQWLRWQLSWGLTDLQAAALLGAGLAGAVAWTRGAPGDAFRGYVRLLTHQGARLAVVFLIGGLVAGAGAAVATFTLLSLPTSTWTLNAADSYAHYLTLPVGLWTLAAMVDLSEQSLPTATLIPAEEPALVATA